MLMQGYERTGDGVRWRQGVEANPWPRDDFDATKRVGSPRPVRQRGATRALLEMLVPTGEGKWANKM